MKLTAIVITKNEEKNIERCLRSLSFADEILVVDSGSTDNTTALAEKAGARVINHPWQGYGYQKNMGTQHTTAEWLLFLDADEEVPAALAQEIKQVIENRTSPYLWVKVVTIFLGSPLKHLSGHNPRLFRRGEASWNTSQVHEQVILADGSPLRLQSNDPNVLPTPLLHHSHPTIASYLERMHHYTSLDAKEMATTHQHRSGRPVQPTWWLPLHLAVRQWVKLLFYRQGILDGWAGIVWCTLSAYYEYEMGRKYLTLVSNAPKTL